MRNISYKQISDAVYEMAVSSIYDLDDKMIRSLKSGLINEEDFLSKTVLKEIIENSDIARTNRIPICQDTGIVVCFLEVGNEVHFDFLIDDAINDGIKRAYIDERFRMSVVKHPLDRVNTRTNTPCIIHTRFVLGDRVKITICPKGAGSENLSSFKMLVPTSGIDGVKNTIIDAVKNAGGRVCPPMIVGVGIGGNFEESAILSKMALIRDLDDRADDEIARKLEVELLEEINKLNIGPMGVGGKTTAIAVKVNVGPCHIASLPVSVNFQCHASRHKEMII